MYELAKKALKLAEQTGAEEAEVYYAANHSQASISEKMLLKMPGIVFLKGWESGLS